MVRTAVVTGGAGFIGSHLSQKLFQNKYNVIVYDDLTNGSGRNNLNKKIKFIKGSILDVKKFESVCKKADVVFNLAVKPLGMSFKRPEEVVEVNDYGTYLVAKICSNLGCELIHVSSSEAYGTAQKLPMKEDHPLFPTTIYASSKAASELYVRGFHYTDGLKMVIVRPFNCYGEFMRTDTYSAATPKFYSRISKGLPPIIHGSGKQTRDFSYVDDTSEGIMLADQNKSALGETFNIGQGKEVSIKKVAQTMIEKYREITGENLKLKLKYVKPRKGDVMRHLASISKARKILGYRPRVTLDDGISRYIKWKLQTSRKRK